MRLPALLMSRRGLSGAVLLAGLLIAAGTYALAASLHTSHTLTRIDVHATPIATFDNHDPTRTRFGALEFRGGLVLTSSYEAFGGISALKVEPDGGSLSQRHRQRLLAARPHPV